MCHASKIKRLVQWKKMNFDKHSQWSIHLAISLKVNTYHESKDNWKCVLIYASVHILKSTEQGYTIVKSEVGSKGRRCTFWSIHGIVSFRA